MREREPIKFPEHAIIPATEMVTSDGRKLSSKEKYFNLGVELAANREVMAPISLHKTRG